MWRRRVTLPWLAATLAATAVGCGGDSSGPGGDVEAGRFTAELSGAFSQSLEGTAFYFQAEDGLTISLSEGGGGTGVVLARSNSALPAVGTYQVLPSEAALATENDFLASSFFNGSGGMILCFSGDLDDPESVSGSIDITASASNLEGDFTTLVACLDPSDGVVKSATLTGRFNAVAGPSE